MHDVYLKNYENKDKFYPLLNISRDKYEINISLMVDWTKVKAFHFAFGSCIGC